MGDTAYKFKYDNRNLEDYIEERRYIAKQKRLEADIQVRLAEAIEAEANLLVTQLLEVANG